MSDSLYQPRFIVILVLQFVLGMSFSSFFLLPKYLAEVQHADASLIGRIMAAAPISAVLVMPLLARHIDHVRRHFLLFAAGLALGAAALGFAVMARLGPSVYVLRALQGMAWTAYMSTGAVLVAEISPVTRLGQALGLLGAANLATNALAPAIAEPLALARGWEPVFFLSAGCSVVAALGTLALREPSRHHAEPRRARATLSGARQRGLLYACMVIGVAFGTVVTFYQPLALSLGIQRLRDLFIGYTVTALGVRVLFGSWLDRFERRRVALFAMTAYGTVVLATSALRPGWLFPLGLGLGLAHGSVYPVLSALFIEDADPRVRGALMTYFGGSFNVGLVMSTLGLGSIADVVGYRPIFGLAALLVASAVVVIARVVAPASGPLRGVLP